MSVRSPNGSTSSIISSEDSSKDSSKDWSQASLTRHSSQHSIHSQPSTSSSLSPSASSQTSNSKQPKLCRVCGDRAKSYHFGGISCDSCKAFFRRSVQNDGYRNFHCPYERQCQITITSRKSCQFCRFYKCLSIGMEKSWVMTEEERMQMLKHRMEKRKQEEIVHRAYRSDGRHTLQYQPDMSQLGNHLTEEQVKLIEHVMNLYAQCVEKISFKSTCDKSTPSRTDILNIFFTAIQQFALFAQQLESFNGITAEDQQILLSGGVLEMCFLRGAFVYDMNGKFWPYRHDSTSIFYSSQLQIMVTQSLLEKHMHFIKTIKRLHLDDTCNMLLILIVLLSSDREGLADSHLVQREQETYLLLLKSYMNWRFGIEMSSIMYAKVLMKLTDLRELAEAHTDYHLLLCKQELNEIQERLSTLHIGITSIVHNDNPMSRGLTLALSPPSSLWTISKCLIKDSSTITSICADDELSTSSEGSEKLLPSD